jgi:hypothetical protein
MFPPRLAERKSFGVRAHHWSTFENSQEIVGNGSQFFTIFLRQVPHTDCTLFALRAEHEKSRMAASSCTRTAPTGQSLGKRWFDPKVWLLRFPYIGGFESGLSWRWFACDGVEVVVFDAWLPSFEEMKASPPRTPEGQIDAGRLEASNATSKRAQVPITKPSGFGSRED